MRQATNVTLLTFLSLGLSTHVQAAPIFSTGAGSAVTLIEASATFDSLTDNAIADLSTYTEAGLNVQSQVSWLNYALCGAFNGCWYGNGGISDPQNYWASISAMNGDTIHGVEFQISSGGGIAVFNNFKWESYLDGNLTGSNTYTYTGTDVYGLYDPVGFDELRLALVGTDGLSTHNVIGLDDLNVQFSAASVSSPAGILLMMLGLSAWGISRRQRRPC